MIDFPPSTNGCDGRGGNGRFLPGNRIGKGNPLAGRVAKFRAAALETVTFADMRRIVRKLVDLAIGGDVAAAREVLSRCLGPAESVDLLERIENLENGRAEK
jgi:hypothetical protein